MSVLEDTWFAQSANEGQLGAGSQNDRVRRYVFCPVHIPGLLGRQIPCPWVESASRSHPENGMTAVSYSDATKNL